MKISELKIIKAKLMFKILMMVISLTFMALCLWVIIDLINNKTKNVYIIVICIIAIMFLAFDQIYQGFRVIYITNNVIQIKFMNISLRKDIIHEIKVNTNRYGIRKYTHFGKIKSIIVNGKYFSAISEMDNNYHEIETEIHLTTAST
jgi:hypothetical protein